MRRPRKAAADAHISGYSWPQFTDDDWEDLERIIGVELDDKVRKSIVKAAIDYTEETLLQQDGAQRSKMLGQIRDDKHRTPLPLTALHKSLRQLVTDWGHADLDPSTARLLSDFAAEIKVPSKGALDFEKIRLDLMTIAQLFERFLARMHEGVSLTHDTFSLLIHDLRTIVNSAGGKVTVAIPTDDMSKHISPFVEFVSRVNRCLPPEVVHPPASTRSLSMTVYRALKKHNN